MGDLHVILKEHANNVNHVNPFLFCFWCPFTFQCFCLLYNEQLHEAKLISFRKDDCKRADFTLVIVAAAAADTLRDSEGG